MKRRTKILGALSAVIIGVLVALGVGHKNDKEAAPAELPAPAMAASATPSPDGIALADPNARAVREPSSPNAWGGPRSGQESTLSDRVVDYKIEARLDPDKHWIDGREQLTWRNRSQREVRAVYLHLYLNAFEGEGSTFMSEARVNGFKFRSDVPIKEGDWGHIKLGKVAQGGATVPWQFVHPDNGPATDHTVVRLDLPAAVAPGASTTLDIGFLGQLPRVLARTGYFGSFHLVGQWFPKMGVLELPGERGATEPRWNAHEFHMHSEFYADFGSYDVSLTVPEGYTVGATGEETGEPVRKDGWITRRFVQGDVHDFAWTADKRSAPVLEGEWTGEGSPKVKIKVLFPPEYAHNAPAVLKATQDSLSWFSKTLGPYPYKTVTAVIPPYNAKEAGGMEYPTFFTAEGYAKLEPKTIDEFALDFVTIHEFGHGYFYGLLASNEFEEPMLDEGLNEYWDQRMMRDRKQDIYLTTGLMRRLGIGLQGLKVFDMERLTAGLNNPPDGLGENSWHRFSSRSYQTVYSRTATTMRDLEEAIGHAKLEEAFKVYYARWKFRHPSVADFREVLAEVSGQPALVNKVFDTQVYASTKIDDRVDSLKCEEELPLLGSYAPAQGDQVEVTEDKRDAIVKARREAWKKAHPAEAAKARDGEIAGPFPWRCTVVARRAGTPVAQTLLVKFADGSSQTLAWNDGSLWLRQSWVKPVKVVSVELDPKGLHYADLNRIDNSLTTESDARPALRLTTDFAALSQSFLALISTL
ncbi:MAG: M1 family metallopeptidase [Paucibacter sp.]|nr:M1 family metallopeptidase [Roseateles sp.]